MNIQIQNLLWLFWLSMAVLLLVACGGGNAVSDTSSPAANKAPIAQAGTNQRLILNFDSAILDGSGSSDPDGDALTYQWEIIQQPTDSKITLSNSDTDYSEFIPDLVGSYRVQLTVSDGELIHVAIIDIDVAANMNPTANAGPDMDANRGETLKLDGRESIDPDGHSLSYTWTQIINECPDVTGGAGTLSGAQPDILMPTTVCALSFDLRVDDGEGASFADRVFVHVLEDKNHSLFVDGDNGSNVSGDGSRTNPFASLRHALSQVTPDQEDIYVMALSDVAQRYDESLTTLTIPDGTSLYGGYSADWERDVRRTPTRLLGSFAAIDFITINTDTWFSGFDLQTINAKTRRDTLFAIRAVDGISGVLYVEDNIIITGHAAVSLPEIQGTPGANYGIFASQLAGLEVRRNTLNIGDASNGLTGKHGAKGADGDPGKDGSGSSGGAGGSGINTGGKGGNGAVGLTPATAGGANSGGDPGGNAGGSPFTICDATSGDWPRFATTSPGYTGRVGAPGVVLGTFGSTGYALSNGRKGHTGTNGGSGAAGGGGDCAVFVITFTSFTLSGGGGGGGGSGAVGGIGGTGGIGGAASIGIYTYAISDQTIVDDNTITAGNGGAGGDGGNGGNGGIEGSGGKGAAGSCSSLGCFFGQAGDGGDAHKGGTGGGGGGGGASAGGPSFALVIGSNIHASINNNQLASANGGGGGLFGYSGLRSWDVRKGRMGIGGIDGNGGYSFAIYVVNPKAGMLPVMSGNTLSHGVGGSAGGTTGIVGKAGNANFIY